MLRVTVRAQARETGLRSIGSAPRGYTIHVNGERAGSVSPNPIGFLKWQGWFWSVPMNTELGIMWKNTAAEDVFYPTKESARDACVAYIKDCLKKKEEKTL